METINTILSFIGILIMLPLFISTIVLIVLGVGGLIKKDYTKFKEFLKIWKYLILAFFILLVLHFVANFIFISTTQ